MSSADGASDQNMDSILASIRRIISDDTTPESQPGAELTEHPGATNSPDTASLTQPVATAALSPNVTALPTAGDRIVPPRPGFSFPPQQFPPEPEGLKPAPSDVVGVDVDLSSVPPTRPLRQEAEPVANAVMDQAPEPAALDDAMAGQLGAALRADTEPSAPDGANDLDDELTSLAALTEAAEGSPAAKAAVPVEPLPTWQPIDAETPAVAETGQSDIAETSAAQTSPAQTSSAQVEAADLGAALANVDASIVTTEAPTADEPLDLGAAMTAAAVTSDDVPAAELLDDASGVDAVDPASKDEAAAQNSVHEHNDKSANGTTTGADDAEISAEAAIAGDGAPSGDATSSDDATMDKPSLTVAAADQTSTEADAEASAAPPASTVAAEPAPAGIPSTASALPASRPAVAGTADALVSPVGRSLEDTVAGMLRPMLKDWLDENMPRLVHKALQDGPPLIGGSARTVTDTVPNDKAPTGDEAPVSPEATTDAPAKRDPSDV